MNGSFFSLKLTTCMHDEVVMSLYGLEEDQKQMIRELYKVSSISEYFDRLEEYIGFEDMQLEF